MKPPRNSFVLPMILSRKSEKFKDRREERGGAKKENYMQMVEEEKTYEKMFENEFEKYNEEAISKALVEKLPETSFGLFLENESVELEEDKKSFIINLHWLDLDHPDRDKKFRISVEEVK